jgi:hypothetical protein
VATPKSSRRIYYDRGVLDGEVAARLAGHDVHLTSIDVHLTEMLAELRQLRIGVQRIEATATAGSADLVSTATAVGAVRAERRMRVEQVYYVIGMVGVFLAVGLSLFAVFVAR